MTDSLSRVRSSLEGRYLVERELGQGGMATGYLCEGIKHKRKVMADAERVDDGRQRLVSMRSVFDSIESRFGVDRHVVAAIWGIGALMPNVSPRWPAVS